MTNTRSEELPNNSAAAIDPDGGEHKSTPAILLDTDENGKRQIVIVTPIEAAARRVDDD